MKTRNLEGSIIQKQEDDNKNQDYLKITQYPVVDSGAIPLSATPEIIREASKLQGTQEIIQFNEHVESMGYVAREDFFRDVEKTYGIEREFVEQAIENRQKKLEEKVKAEYFPEKKKTPTRLMYEDVKRIGRRLYRDGKEGFLLTHAVPTAVRKGQNMDMNSLFVAQVFNLIVYGIIPNLSSAENGFITSGGENNGYKYLLIPLAINFISGVLEAYRYYKKKAEKIESEKGV